MKTLTTFQLFKPPESKQSSKETLKDRIQYMRSPIFWVHQLTQVLTLYSCNLSTAVVNDVMRTSKNLKFTTYEKLQGQYEIVRGVLSICLPAIFGVIMDSTSKLWKYLKFPTKHDDLKYSLIFSVLHGACLFVLAGSIYHHNVWIRD